MERQLEHELQLLRQAGLRATPQRLAVLSLVLNSTSHPGPEAVYRSLAPRHPGLSMNTVYQTLHTLEESGILRRVAGQESTYRYDANVRPHVHLVCKSCGRVDDCSDHTQLLGDLHRAVAAQTAWTLVDQDPCFYGYCPSCQESGSSSTRRSEHGDETNR